jgi:hypothetical protein
LFKEELYLLIEGTVFTLGEVSKVIFEPLPNSE